MDSFQYDPLEIMGAEVQQCLPTVGVPGYTVESNTLGSEEEDYRKHLII